jgi:hypothetical protein
MATLGEVQTVAHIAPNAIELRPLDELGADAALQNKILEQAPHVIVRERRGHGRLQAETAAQPARDIVFAAAFPDSELNGWCGCGPRRGRGGA